MVGKAESKFCSHQFSSSTCITVIDERVMGCWMWWHKSLYSFKSLLSSPTCIFEIVSESSRPHPNILSLALVSDIKLYRLLSLTLIKAHLKTLTWHHFFTGQIVERYYKKNKFLIKHIITGSTGSFPLPLHLYSLKAELQPLIELEMTDEFICHASSPIQWL